MKSQTISGNIEIRRNGNKLESVSVVMPIWDKIIEDGSVSVQIPLFSISTFAKDDADIDDAVKEAIHVFCLNAEKFGNGIELELKSIGWNIVEKTNNFSSLSFEISQKNQMLGQIMQTGEQFAQMLKIAC